VSSHPQLPGRQSRHRCMTRSPSICSCCCGERALGIPVGQVEPHPRPANGSVGVMGARGFHSDLAARCRQPRTRNMGCIRPFRRSRLTFSMSWAQTAGSLRVMSSSQHGDASTGLPHGGRADRLDPDLQAPSGLTTSQFARSTDRLRRRRPSRVLDGPRSRQRPPPRSRALLSRGLGTLSAQRRHTREGGDRGQLRHRPSGRD